MHIALSRRFSVLLLPVLAAALLAACGADDRDEESPKLTIDPEIIIQSPTLEEVLILSGEVEPRALVEVTQSTATEEGRKIALVDPDAPEAGAWEAEFTLESGTNNIAITATDKSGNTHLIRMTIVLDQTDPAVTAFTPAENAQSLPIDSNVTVTFSEVMKKETISKENVQLKVGENPIATTVTYDETLRLAILDPTENLLPSTEYTVVLTPLVTDLAGNTLPEKTWKFTTQAAQ